MQERLQKIIASAGICSRRKAEQLILTGKVSVNGHILKELGVKADPEIDRITVDGKPIKEQPKKYFIMNKPRGVVTTTSDELGRETIFDLIDPRMKLRLFSAGRLDYDTEGVLLLTTDGELVNRLTHPSRKVTKEYVVKVKDMLSEEQIEKLEAGVKLDGIPTKPIKVYKSGRAEKNSWYKFVLREGRNRQIKRMLEAVESRCLKITRTRFAGLDVEDIKPGEMRELTEREILELKVKAGMATLKGRVKPGRPTRRTDNKKD